MSAPETVAYSPKCTMEINIPNDAKRKPDFAVRDLEVDSEVEITVKGVVRRIEHDQYNQNCKLDITGVSITGAEPKTSLSAAIKRVKQGINTISSGRGQRLGLTGRDSMIKDDMGP